MSTIETLRETVSHGDNLILDSEAATTAAANSQQHAQTVVRGLVTHMDNALRGARHFGDTLRVTQTYVESSVGAITAAEAMLHGASDGTRSDHFTQAISLTQQAHHALTGGEASAAAVAENHIERANRIADGLVALLSEANSLVGDLQSSAAQLDTTAVISLGAHEAAIAYRNDLDGLSASAA